MAVTTTNLGVITAYGDAVAAGYTGTKAEWQALMASYATVGQQAVDAKNAAVAAKDTAVSKATEATTAANTATTKASEASASAQSIAQSASQIQENADDIAQLKSDLTTKADLDELYKAFPTDTASGAVASFADGANVPVKSLIVNIDPVQSGSGDPSPTNVRPISGWSEVNVNACGVNVWDEQWENGFINDAGQNSALTTALRSKNYISVIPNTAYFVCCPKYAFVFYYDGNKDFIAKDTTHGSGGNLRNEAFTIPQNVRYMRFTVYDTPTYNNDISINYPATDHDCHPYSGQNINIQLGQTVYGGKLDVTNGVMTVDNICINPSDFTISRVSGNGTTTTVLISDITQGKASTAISNRFSENIPSNTAGRMVHIDTKIYVILLTADLTSDSNDGVRAWFSNNPTQICYELAIPITVQLTPHEVTALLGSNNVWADSGDSTVEYRADPTLYIGRLTEPDADMVADANITSGQYFMVGNTLYKATANIASGGAITPNVNCTRKSLSEALNELNA